MANSKDEKSAKKGTSGNIVAEAEAQLEVWKRSGMVAGEYLMHLQTEREKLEKRRAPGHPMPDQDRLRLIDLETRWLEAEDAQRTAAAMASALLHAIGMAQRDPHVLLSDIGELQKDLSELVAASERAYAAYLDANRLVETRIANAYAAHQSVAAKHAKAGLPPPPAMPRPLQTWMGDTTRNWVETTLANHAPAPAKSNAAKIEKLRREEIQIRAALEERELEREERQAEAKRQAAAEQREEKRRAHESEQEHKARIAKHQAERNRINSLAAAHRAREAEKKPGRRIETTAERVVDGESGALLE